MLTASDTYPTSHPCIRVDRGYSASFDVQHIIVVNVEMHYNIALKMTLFQPFQAQSILEKAISFLKKRKTLNANCGQTRSRRDL